MVHEGFTNLVRVALVRFLGDDPPTMSTKESPVESFARFFEAAMPEGLAQSVSQNLRAAASSAFEKMDLVSREELDVQQRVLLRTREKLELLEKQVAELEEKLLNK